VAGRQIPTTRNWVAYDVLRGSTFITNLRIAWIREINALPRPPIMVQFLGTADGLVTEDDSRDCDRFPTGSQKSFPAPRTAI